MNKEPTDVDINIGPVNITVFGNVISSNLSNFIPSQHQSAYERAASAVESMLLVHNTLGIDITDDKYQQGLEAALIDMFPCINDEIGDSPVKSLLSDLEDVDEINVPREETTCFHCEDNETCDYAWDPQNTDGDCLIMK